MFGNDAISKSDFLYRILSGPILPHICFVEQDADDAAGGGGDDDGADDAPDDADDSAEDGAEGDDSDDGAEDEDPDDGADAPDDDSDELEIGPEKLKVPKKVKEAWNGLQATIQKKGEETAAAKKAHEADQQRMQETMRIAATYVEDISAIKVLETQINAIQEDLKPYEDLTPAQWMEWAEREPDNARKAQLAVQALVMKRDGLRAQIGEKRSAVGAKEADLRKRADEEKAANDNKRAELQANAEREIAAKIKDWSPAKKDALGKLAGAFGFTPEEFAGVQYDPRVMVILNELHARRAAADKARAAAAAGKVKDLPPPPEPIAKKGKGGSTAPLRLDDKQSMASFAKNFARQRSQHKQTRPR